MTNDWIETVLSPARFGPYLEACNGDLEAAIQLYLWHVEVAAAFYPWLHWLEVALRNAAHGRLAENLGRDEWWNCVQLNKYGATKLTAAKRKAREKRGAAYNADDIVPELPFGFWASLIECKSLSVPILHGVFPHYAGDRRGLRGELAGVVNLRNRIMHHERVHAADMPALSASIHRLLGCLAPDLAGLLASHDRMAELMRRRPPAATEEPS